MDDPLAHVELAARTAAYARDVFRRGIGRKVLREALAARISPPARSS